MCNSTTKKGIQCKITVGLNADGLCGRHQKAVVALGTCDTILSRGARKGQVCGVAAYEDNKCKRHSDSKQTVVTKGNFLIWVRKAKFAPDFIGPFKSLEKCQETAESLFAADFTEVDAENAPNCLMESVTELDSERVIVRIFKMSEPVKGAKKTQAKTKKSPKPKRAPKEGGCVYRFTKGQNKDELCGKAIKDANTQTCSKHLPKEKKQKKAVVLKPVETSEPVAADLSDEKELPPSVPLEEGEIVAEIPVETTPPAPASPVAQETVPKKKRAGKVLKETDADFKHKEDQLDIQFDFKYELTDEVFDYPLSEKDTSIYLNEDDEFVIQNPEKKFTYSPKLVFEAVQAALEYLREKRTIAEISYNKKKVIVTTRD